MDLSQQELPLTSYFTRDRKDSGSRTVFRERDKHTQEHPHSVARPSKRKRNDAATPLSSSVSRSNSRPTVLQLPTPAASARKRMRSGQVGEPSGKEQSTSTDPMPSPVASSAVRSSEKDSAQFCSGPAPSEPPRTTTEIPTFLATPSTGRRRTAKLIDRECSPSFLLSDHRKTDIVTSQTPPERVSKHRTDRTSLVTSDSPLPRKRNRLFAPRDSTSAMPSESTNAQPPHSHVISVFSVSSSQSQYLLPIDATPKRKRRLLGVRHVTSSQTQEESELTLSPLVASGDLAIKHSREKNLLPGSALVTPISHSEQRNRQPGATGYSLIGSPVNSSPGPSHSLAKNKVSDKPLPDSLSPSRVKLLTPGHSPSRKIRTPRRTAHHNSIELPPAHIEDSVTEPESDSDIIQALHHSRVPRNVCPPMRRGLAQGGPPTAEDDSATEAESDTDILHCVAEIGKKRPRERRSETSKENAILPLVISPLVSPARPRIASMPTVLSSTQFAMQDGAELSFSGLHTSFPPTMERPTAHSGSLPSVVRDFIRMFPGDESYPADFPESLRI